MVYYLSINVCFYFLRSSWGRLANGFTNGPNLNQCFRNFNRVALFLTPSLSLACNLSEMLLIYVFPRMMMCVCVCVCGAWSFFFWHKLRGVKHVKTFSLWNFTQSLVVKMRYSAKGFWLTSDPGRCWWRRGVKLLACCLARALVFSAYGCHVLPPPHPLRAKWVHCSLCVQSYIQSYRSTILQS